MGGAGDDYYEVEGTPTSYANFDDIVVEAAGEGYDTVFAHSYSAILPDNVEKLINWGISGTGTVSSAPLPRC